MTLVSEKIIHQYLDSSPNWKLKDNAIVADFTFKDFVEAMVFVNKVADISESEGHHPDIRINWNKVNLELCTHSEGGLTEKDFALAEKINAL